MVLVFKTNVNHPDTVQQLSPSLNRSLPRAHWNFDLDDCDRILRIEGTGISSREVAALMAEEGFRCEELE